MRVVLLSVRCSLSLSVCVALTACCPLCMLLRLHIALSLHVALSACRSFCVLLALSDSLDCLSRSALSLASRCLYKSFGGCRAGGSTRARSHARSRARSSSPVPSTQHAVPVRNQSQFVCPTDSTLRSIPFCIVPSRQVSSRCTSFSFFFFIYLLFLCELLIYWNNS